MHPASIGPHLYRRDRSSPLHGKSSEQIWTSSSGSHHCCRRRTTHETAVPYCTSLKPHTTHHTPQNTPPHYTPPPHVFKSGSPKVLKCCKYCMLYIIYYISGVDIYIYMYINIYIYIYIICLLLYVHIIYIIYIIYNIQFISGVDTYAI